MADRPTLTAQLRALSRHEHSDLSIGGEAADVIEVLTAHIRAVELNVDGFRERGFTLKAETDALLNRIKTHCRDAAALAADKGET